MGPAGWIAGVAVAAMVAAGGAQPVPQPFPTPADRGQTEPSTQSATPVTGVVSEPEPTEQALGLPIYPGSTFLGSYDAGRGQRYYLFGTNIGFNELVGYYRTVLKARGDLVFDVPATHIFEVGRFREDTMAFPPGVTIKDHMREGSEGYPNPKPGADPPGFRSVIQIVPVARD